MAEAETSEGKLYTLTDVAKATNISMPTLQRYKKMYQDRIPSVGKGRSQRYPEAAIAVFEELKKENVGKRGRPRKTAGAAPKAARKPKAAKAAAPKKKAAGRPKKAAAPQESGGSLTLTQIGKLTKISYPTLLRYVKTHLAEIPHQGTGRARRYLPEAVDVFKRLRQESPRGRAAAKGQKAAAKKRGPGRPKKAAAKKRGPGRPRKAAAKGSGAAAPAGVGDLKARLAQLEKSNKDLARTLSRLEKKLAKPIKLVGVRK